MPEKSHLEWAGLGWFVAVFALLILCEGDPDIIDGWAKRANQVECLKPESEVAK